MNSSLASRRTSLTAAIDDAIAGGGGAISDVVVGSNATTGWSSCFYDDVASIADAERDWTSDSKPTVAIAAIY